LRWFYHNDAQSKQRTQNLRHGGHDDREGRNLGPKGPGPKAFGGTVRDAHFLRHFRAPGNVFKYDGKTNPIVWLEDYRLACRVGRANDNLFII
jgi:hypothetical protein